MNNLLNSLPREIVYVIVFVFILVILVAVFILINPNFLFGYYTPGFLGWSGYLPWFGPAYNGLSGLTGYGGIYPYFSSPYIWNNPFLYSQLFWGNAGPRWNIYGNLWSYPYAWSLGELLLVVPPAGDPIFIDEYVIEEEIIATVSGFLDVPISPEELIILTDPILNVLAANPALLPDFWALYPDLAVTNPDLYAAILLI